MYQRSIFNDASVSSSDKRSRHKSTRGPSTHLGILASFVPFLLPKPLCRPIRLAALSSLALALECTTTGFRIMRPSETSLRTVWRELALEISFCSFGSSHILRLPHPTTLAARRFCVRRLTLQYCLMLVCVCPDQMMYLTSAASWRRLRRNNYPENS